MSKEVQHTIWGMGSVSRGIRKRYGIGTGWRIPTTSRWDALLKPYTPDVWNRKAPTKESNIAKIRFRGVKYKQAQNFVGDTKPKSYK